MELDFDPSGLTPEEYNEAVRMHWGIIVGALNEHTFVKECGQGTTPLAQAFYFLTKHVFESTGGMPAFMSDEHRVDHGEQENPCAPVVNVNCCGCGQNQGPDGPYNGPDAPCGDENGNHGPDCGPDCPEQGPDNGPEGEQPAPEQETPEEPAQ